MLDKVKAVVDRYEELNRLLASPEVNQDPDKLRTYAQEQADLAELHGAASAYLRLRQELQDARALLAEERDPEMGDLIRDEIAALEERMAELERRLLTLLVPTDPRDRRNVIVEIRAGTGGEEAALFAADLFRMYSLYAVSRDWKAEVLDANETGIGGYKEIIFEVRGQGVYSRLKYESGVHRVQRVPVTETGGRIHTSTATVAVLPQADEVEVRIDDKDLRIDVFRSGGKGGQSVNTTDSAVRITHLPTGIVAQSQDERSQLQNRARAMAVLRARLYEREYQRQFSAIDEARRTQVGTGERSEKIRTYNFPQNRVTDHRINLSIYRIEAVLAGDLDEFIDALIAQEQTERLQAQPA